MAAKLSGSGGGKFNLGQNSDINVTPFVDVMLVLLIIFMVSAPLATVSIKVDIPPAVPPPPNAPKPKEPVYISIHKSGQLAISDKSGTSLDRLIPDITQALGGSNPRNEQVMIRSNRYVPYKDFMTVLNTLQEGGYLKIGLIAEDL
jgi:biopolymer transport protein ExbD